MKHQKTIILIINLSTNMFGDSLPEDQDINDHSVDINTSLQAETRLLDPFNLNLVRINHSIFDIKFQEKFSIVEQVVHIVEQVTAAAIALKNIACDTLIPQGYIYPFTLLDFGSPISKQLPK